MDLCSKPSNLGTPRPNKNNNIKSGTIETAKYSHNL